MNEQIFILNNDNKLIELNESDFVTEDELQALLENYPNLISGSQINPDNPRKWILISREVGIPGEDGGSNIWSVDHLFIDQDGIPTLVEVKRSTDTRIRREVVGQMLDYAANSVSYWTIDEIINKFNKNCQAKNIDPDQKISEFLGDEMDLDKFIDTVESNLRAGKIRLIFVADKIPDELKAIIEFLNYQMSPAEVLGIEIKQYANQKIKTLVPRVIGKTASATVKKGHKDNKQWDYGSFMDNLLSNTDNAQVETALKIIEHFARKTRIWYGRGKTYGSVVPILDLTHSNQLFALWSSGTVEIYFQHHKNKPPFDELEKRKELLNSLNGIPGVDLSEDRINGRPYFPLEVLKNEKNLKKFLEIYDWVMEQTEKYQKTK